MAVSAKLLTGVGGATSAVVGIGVSTIPFGSGRSVGLTFVSNETLRDFKGGICVDELLSGEEKALFDKAGIEDGKWSSLKDKFKNNTGESKGCLAIGWNKGTGNDGWRGAIKYEGLFSKGHETIVVDGLYNSIMDDADPDDGDQKQDSDKNNGRAVYINTKTKEKGGLMWQKNKGIEDKLLVKPELMNREGVGSFDKSKKCQSGACNGKNPQIVEEEGKWKGGKGKSKSFGDWHKHFTDVFKFIYDGGGKTLEALKTLVKDEKGSWEKL